MSSDPPGTVLQRITAGTARALHDISATRALEAALMARLPAHTLMQRAGASVARLTLAVAPHANTIWVACGPGNNGGDGLQAAAWLQRMGKTVYVSWIATPGSVSDDTRASWQLAKEAGVQWMSDCPPHADFHIDALLGIGTKPRPFEEPMRGLLQRLREHPDTTLAIDIPTGLDADHGTLHDAELAVHARHCLTLLTLKPGLFTGHGRDVAQTVWLDDLGLDALDPNAIPSARCGQLLGAPVPLPRSHASHKGSYGDVVVLGGARGMAGAALLAGRAALHAGAGRVYVVALDNSLSVDPQQPELMFRSPGTLDLREASVAAGCGGGSVVREALPAALTQSRNLVLDADALNVVASDPALRQLLVRRTQRLADCTVLTPHPLEAARLLGCGTQEIQAARRPCALELARSLGCVVMLKGSGSIIASPDGRAWINPTGNARLATAGTGDVLAGMTASVMAQGFDALHAAQWACYRHGALAQAWPRDQPLTASALAAAVTPPAT